MVVVVRSKFASKCISLTLLGGIALGSVAGCETKAGTGALVGGAAGAGIGAIIGHNSHNRTGSGAVLGAATGFNPLLGALVGGAAGAGIGAATTPRRY